MNPVSPLPQNNTNPPSAETTGASSSPFVSRTLVFLCVAVVFVTAIWLILELINRGKKRSAKEGKLAQLVKEDEEDEDEQEDEGEMRDYGASLLYSDNDPKPDFALEDDIADDNGILHKGSEVTLFIYSCFVYQ